MFIDFSKAFNNQQWANVKDPSSEWSTKQNYHDFYISIQPEHRKTFYPHETKTCNLTLKGLIVPDFFNTF